MGVRYAPWFLISAPISASVVILSIFHHHRSGHTCTQPICAGILSSSAASPCVGWRSDPAEPSGHACKRQASDALSSFLDHVDRAAPRMRMHAGLHFPRSTYRVAGIPSFLEPQNFPAMNLAVCNLLR